MKIEEIIDKIPEVWAAARIIVQKYGHTKKFAKHIVALVIRQIEDFTDAKLVDFLCRDKIGKILGYKKRPDLSTFSKVRERSNPGILAELYEWILQDLFKGKQVQLIAQDSTDIPAYSRKKDEDARWGVRTIPKKRQIDDEEKVEPFFGYKIHMIADVTSEIPIAFYFAPGNMHDKRAFLRLFEETRKKVTLRLGTKYLADSAMDATDVRRELHDNSIKDVIAINGRRWRESEIPKDPDYGKRWNIEHIFSRLKEVLGMAKNRFIGAKRVLMHVYLCLTAYLVSYAM